MSHPFVFIIIANDKLHSPHIAIILVSRTIKSDTQNLVSYAVFQTHRLNMGDMVLDSAKCLGVLGRFVEGVFVVYDYILLKIIDLA